MSFLTANEKRAAVGYGPLRASDEEALVTGPFEQPAFGKYASCTALKYRPDQPRVPAGNSDGGQWVDEGGGSTDVNGDTRRDRLAANEGPKILGRGPKDFGQRLNTPSAKDVEVRADHIVRGHTAQGSAYKTSIRDGGSKTAFPERMTPAEIEKAVREAYSNAREVSSPQYSPDGKIRLLEGESGGLTIRMYYNATKKRIDAAFPRR